MQGTDQFHIDVVSLSDMPGTISSGLIRYFLLCAPKSHALHYEPRITILALECLRMVSIYGARYNVSN
jgi:hypothetical protein